MTVGFRDSFTNIVNINLISSLCSGADRLLQHAAHPAAGEGARVRLRLAGDSVAPRLHGSDPGHDAAAEGQFNISLIQNE